jgi:hypothetical protein
MEQFRTWAAERRPDPRRRPDLSAASVEAFNGGSMIEEAVGMR